MPSSVMRRVAALLLTGAILAAAGTTSLAQRRRGGYGAYIRMATPASFDGGFNFCRVMFRGNRYGDGGGWGVDYPRADINLSIRLKELTRAHVSMDPEGEPNHVVVQLTDEELFKCPFIMMTEVGSAYFDEAESARLRDYLLKGGFLWADDFWGSYAWESWYEAFSQVLPPGEYPVHDLPTDHLLFRSHFDVAKIPQIPSINAWMRSGSTSERGADSAEVHTRAILDKAGRVMVLMTHNTDIGDSWEREGDDPDYFYRFSVDGYAVAINVLVYAMSH